MRPESGSVRMMRIVSARLRVLPLRVSTPRMSVLVGEPSMPPDGVVERRPRRFVILPLASPTAPFRAM